MAASRRILVIEDDAEGGEALCALFTVWGHRVSSAETGQRGIELALAEAPEVIVVDLGLADMDGCDVIRRLRSERPGETPWIIAYSGYHLRKNRAREAGCDVFVLKPAIDELESLILGVGDPECGQRNGPIAAQEPRRRTDVR